MQHVVPHSYSCPSPFKIAPADWVKQWLIEHLVTVLSRYWEF